MGGEINTGSGQVVIDAIYPAAPGTAGFAAFEDDTGYASTWSLTTYAICAPHAERVQITSAIPGNKLNDVHCPTGTVLTSTGGELEGAIGEAWMFEFEVIDSGWLRGRAGSLGTTRSWSATTYGICATESALPGYAIFSATTAVGVSLDKSVTVPCPGATQILGAGVTQGAGVDGSIEGIAPLADRTGATVSVSEVDGSTAPDWAMKGQAMCANPPPGLQVVARATPNDDEEIKTVTATCPAGKHVIGSGGAAPSTFGGVMLDDLRPNAALTNVTVTAIEDSNGHPFPWSAQAIAVCVSR